MKRGSRKKNAGLTLVEIVVVVAILSFILALGLIINFDSYKGYIFRSEQNILVSTLSRARSKSMNNFGQSRHGVCYNTATKNYVLYIGNSYVVNNPTNEYLSGNPSVTLSSSGGDFICGTGLGVVFNQLSGTTSPIEIVLNESGRVSTTSINYEGTIIW